MFSQTVEYALRAMMHLASAGGAAVNGETIAAQTHVPSGYLSKVMRDLVVANLVRSFRGPNGGFLLARAASAISILDVINAVDPIRRVDRCPLGAPEHTHLCGLHRRLDDALAGIEQTFRSTTLAQVVGRDDEPGQCPALHPRPDDPPPDATEHHP